MSDMRLSCRDATNQALRDSVLKIPGPGWWLHELKHIGHQISIFIRGRILCWPSISERASPI